MRLAAIGLYGIHAMLPPGRCDGGIFDLAWSACGEWVAYAVSTGARDRPVRCSAARHAALYVCGICQETLLKNPRGHAQHSRAMHPCAGRAGRTLRRMAQAQAGVTGPAAMTSAIRLCHVDTGQIVPLTDGCFRDTSPSWDPGARCGPSPTGFIGIAQLGRTCRIECRRAADAMHLPRMRR